MTEACVLEEPTNATDSTSTVFTKPVVAKIAAKFQMTVPAEVRDLYDLQEGDLMEFTFNEANRLLIVEPKRASLLSPQLDKTVAMARHRRDIAKGNLKPSETKKSSQRSQ